MKSSTKDKAEGKFHEAKGKIKEMAGKITDDPKLVDELANCPEWLFFVIPAKAGIQFIQLVV